MTILKDLLNNLQEASKFMSETRVVVGVVCSPTQLAQIQKAAEVNKLAPPYYGIPVVVDKGKEDNNLDLYYDPEKFNERVRLINFIASIT